MAKEYVYIFNDVFINENKIDELKIKEEGTKH
jgi:hypothetical protein